MASRRGEARRLGYCLRHAYFGTLVPATTSLSDDPAVGKIYCQECADYLIEFHQSVHKGAERRPPRQITHYDKEAT